MKTLKTLTVVRIDWNDYAFESEKEAITFFSMAKKSLKTNTFNGKTFATKLASRVSLRCENEGVKLIGNEEFANLERIESKRVRKEMLELQKGKSNDNVSK